MDGVAHAADAEAAQATPAGEGIQSTRKAVWSLSISPAVAFRRLAPGRRRRGPGRGPRPGTPRQRVGPGRRVVEAVGAHDRHGRSGEPRREHLASAGRSTRSGGVALVLERWPPRPLRRRRRWPPAPLVDGPRPARSGGPTWWRRRSPVTSSLTPSAQPVDQLVGDRGVGEDRCRHAHLAGVVVAALQGWRARPCRGRRRRRPAGRDAAVLERGTHRRGELGPQAPADPAEPMNEKKPILSLVTACSATAPGTGRRRTSPPGRPASR